MPGPVRERASTDELLPLPPLDGEGDDEEEKEGDEEIDEADDAADPYDDSTGDEKEFAEHLDDDVDSDKTSAVGDDAAGFAQTDDDVPAVAELQSLLGDDDAPGVAGEDFGIIDDESAVRDAGEEGFDAPEPELRVEDLPRLDEGGDEDLSIEEAGDLVAEDDLRWDDRAFERIAARAIGHVVRVRLRGGIHVTLDDGRALRSVDGGETFIAADLAEEDDEALVSRGRARAILRDGVGVLRAIDDGPLTLVESTADATAFTLLEDGCILAATDGPNDRARLVRVDIEGVATVVAEEESSIEALAIDPRSGIVWAGGAFGLIAFRAP